MRSQRTKLELCGPSGLAPLVFALFLACSPQNETSSAQRFTIPTGARLDEVIDTLAAHEIIGQPKLFGLYVRLKGADSQIKAGTYELEASSGWGTTLETLIEGRVVTIPITVPEGWTLRQIGDRLAPIAEMTPDSAVQRLYDPELADSLGAPGPTLEGYLFPETYRFAPGVSIETMAATLYERHSDLWTPARRATLDSLGLTERELTTLASIIQAEARWQDEMPLIAAVYHNRLKRGMRLQADPTVQYALGTRRSRLLFSDIDSVADSPYNTYTHSGLPPGPIGTPGEAAIDAALHPADVPYLYFVAREDGRHEFSRSFAEHNRKARQIQRERRRGGPN